MRLAVLADIHGNLPAFEAVLKDITRHGVDLTIIAGDIVIGSPDSAGCWHLARSLGCPILRGNHERYVAHFDTPDAAPHWHTERFAPLHWAFAQVPAEDRRRMGQLPAALRFPAAPDLVVVHASERDDHDSLNPYTPEPQLFAMFPTVQERFIVRAHNHCAQVRVWQKGLIITSGSVGLPLDGNPTAQYLLLDQDQAGWRIQHQSVEYDLDAALQRFHTTGYLAATGPMGRLFYRELVTAAHQIVPFLRLYARWSKAADLSLEAALARFLNDD